MGDFLEQAKKTIWTIQMVWTRLQEDTNYLKKKSINMLDVEEQWKEILESTREKEKMVMQLNHHIVKEQLWEAREEVEKAMPKERRRTKKTIGSSSWLELEKDVVH